MEDGGGPLQERDQLLGLRLRRLLVNCLGGRLGKVLRLDLPTNESAVDRGRGQPADHRGSVLLQKVGSIVPVGLQLLSCIHLSGYLWYIRKTLRQIRRLALNYHDIDRSISMFLNTPQFQLKIKGILYKNKWKGPPSRITGSQPACHLL